MVAVLLRLHNDVWLSGRARASAKSLGDVPYCQLQRSSIEMYRTTEQSTDRSCSEIFSSTTQLSTVENIRARNSVVALEIGDLSVLVTTRALPGINQFSDGHCRNESINPNALVQSNNHCTRWSPALMPSLA
jgi:hypothetical protein